MPRKDSAIYRAELFVLYLDFRKQGKGMMKACELAHLTPNAIRQRRQVDADFDQAEKDAISRYGEDMEEVIQDAAFGKLRTEMVEGEDGRPLKVIMPTDPAAAQSWLKAYVPEVWNPASKVTVDHTHKLDIKALFTDFNRLRGELEHRKALQAGFIDAESTEEPA